MSLPELAIKRHVTTLMILVSLAVLGTVALIRLPLAFLPDIEEPHFGFLMEIAEETLTTVPPVADEFLRGYRLDPGTLLGLAP